MGLRGHSGHASLRPVTLSLPAWTPPTRKSPGEPWNLFRQTPLPGRLPGKTSSTSGVVLDITKDAMRRAGVRGFEMSVVIPDDSCRIALVTAESLAGKEEDREAFLRWKLKKSVPFDVDTAQIAYEVLGPHEGTEGKGVDVLVALSPRSIVQEYEELLEKLDIHAGYVIPSTIAAMNLRPSRSGGFPSRGRSVREGCSGFDCDDDISEQSRQVLPARCGNAFV